MRTTSLLAVTAIAIAMASSPMIQAASPEIEDITLVPRLTIRSEVGATNLIRDQEIKA